MEAVEADVVAGEKVEMIDYHVLSSSLKLFKNMKDSLKRCLSFSTSKALFDLHIAFKNVFRHYVSLLRKKLQRMGTELEHLALTEEQEMQAVFIANTCEYCLEVVPQI